MLDKDGMPVKRLNKTDFWRLFLLEMPIPIMWISGYNGLLYPIWLAGMMLLVIFLRTKTVTYCSKFGVLNDNARMRDYQERPWGVLLGISVFGFVRIDSVLKYQHNSWLGFFVCGGALWVLPAGALFELSRRVRL